MRMALLSDELTNYKLMGKRKPLLKFPHLICKNRLKFDEFSGSGEHNSWIC